MYTFVHTREAYVHEAVLQHHVHNNGKGGSRGDTLSIPEGRFLMICLLCMAILITFLFFY